MPLVFALRLGCFFLVLLCSCVRELVGGVLSIKAAIGDCAVLYECWQTAYSASRLSSVAALGRRLPLYAAALSTPPASSCEHGKRSTACLLTYLIRSLGAWCEQRSGIKEEAKGRGTAAELCTPSAKACTEQTLKAR